MEFKDCPRCDGRGTINCPKCNGSIFSSMPGKRFDPFGALKGGEIVEDCKYCDGTGELSCSKCDGLGLIDA